MKKQILGGSLLLLILSSSCEKDSPDTPSNPEPVNRDVLILNEGAFQGGNASVGIYDDENEVYNANTFATTNGRPLGDVLQSATLIDDELYLVVNNSGKVEVVEPESISTIATINGLNSPRYVLQVSNSQAYVSNLYSDSIAVIDLNQKSIDHYININNSSEQMVKVGDKVYVTNTYTSNITVVNVLTEAVSTVSTTFNPTAIGVDANNQILVLCGGDEFQGISGAVNVIDPATDQVIREVILANSSYTNHMAFNSSRDSVYLLTGNVYKMATTATAAPATPFIDGSNHSFYGIDYNTIKEEVWLGDAKDFSQQGEVLVYSNSGNQLFNFTCGVNPNGFFFYDF